jgi:adenylate cyclase
MVLSWLLVYVPTEWWIAQQDHQEKMRRLGIYLAPSVLPRVLAENYQDLLQPQRREVTILFADVANYTALSETLQPEVLSQLTQAILSELTAAIHEQQGTLDKYMGDAVMALWGAPLPDEHHADRAITAALQMLERVSACQAAWQSSFGLDTSIQVRIGINTGEVVVGEMGSAMRKTYTAIGDAVNISARLQEQAKVWQHPILLGEATARASHQHQLTSLGSMTLRGKHQAETIYSPTHLGLPKGLGS